MDAQDESKLLHAHSLKIRAIIRDQRSEKKMTEEKVNHLYFNNMAARHLTAPKAIMTKVRDMRRNFLLNKDEAECMAMAIEVDPQLLYPIETAQAELPMERINKPEPVPILVQKPKPRLQVTSKLADMVNHSNTQMQPAASEQKPLATRKPENETTKVSVGFYETQKGLRFVINKKLTLYEFERLTLAIPEYMMKIERQGEHIFCRANVPIFDYQAELLTRAIFGGK